MVTLYGLINRKIMFLILVLFTYNAHGQQIYDLSNISEEKIVFYSKLIVGHENELKDMLLLAIELSLENIVNSNTTRTPIPHIPYKYQYLVVFPDFTFTVMQKEKYKLVYNPSHPDAIRGGELTGYLKFPDIGIDQECLDIAEIIKTLRLIEIECKE